jgi:hypothetical protein
MLRRFFLMEFLNDKCVSCCGEGHIKYPALRPMICDSCHGTGKHASPLAFVAWLALMMFLTIAPIVWIF